MKVLIPKYKLTRSGGLEKQLIALVEGFYRRGCKVTIACSESAPEFSHLPLYHIKPSKWPFFQKATFNQGVKELIEKEKPDLVFGIERSPHASHLRMGDGVHASYLQRKKGLFKRLFHAKALAFEKAIFRGEKTKLFITNSNLVAAEMQSYYQVPKEKIVTVHNGVAFQTLEAPFLQREKESLNLRKNLGLTSKKVVLFVGDDFQRKGLDLLMEAFKYLPSYYHLIVIGSDKRFKSKEPPKGPFSFMGKQDPLPFYQMADLFALPSRYDPFANTTLEALAMGLYVITSPFNGGNEVLSEKTGTICPLLAKAIAKAILEAPQKEAIAPLVRASISHLEIENQIDSLVDACLKR